MINPIVAEYIYNGHEKNPSAVVMDFSEFDPLGGWLCSTPPTEASSIPGSNQVD